MIYGQRDGSSSVDCEIVDSSENIFHNQAASLSLTSRWIESGGVRAVSPDCDDELDLCFSQADHSMVYNGALGGGEEKSSYDDENGSLKSMALERESAISVSVVVVDHSDSDSVSSYSDGGVVIDQREREEADGDGVGVGEDYFGCSSSAGNGAGLGGVSGSETKSEAGVGVDDENEAGNGSWVQRRRLSPGHSLSVALRKFCVEHNVEIERRRGW